MRLPHLAELALLEDDVSFTHPACGHFAEFRGDNTTGNAWREEEMWQMLVGQIYNQYWCGEAIERYTRTTGVSFDVVLKSRPDVTFATPIPPFCAFDYTTKACSARDWIFMLPGSVAVKALKRGYDEFNSCKTIMNRNRTKIAETVVRATGMGKELLEGMSSPDKHCQKCIEPCPGCKRKSATHLRLLRKPGVPSGSIPALLPRECGF